jgi:uncharacterized protein (DUF2141 family)
MKTLAASLLATAVAVAAALPVPAAAAAESPYRHKLANDASACRGSGPAVNVRISGVNPGKGTLRVQLYRATAADWLKTGRWINRIEVPAHGSSATVCMPVPGPGSYGIAVRHDVNGNGQTDLRTDGGGMSNNPAVNILNLGRPSYQKTAFTVGNGVKTISIQVRYL